jgi:ParB family transcriptional regulator, chromosome partitioning protein
MQQVVAVNPFRCRMWHLHDRLDCQINEATCKAEIHSFSKHGQFIPALGRPVVGDPDYDIELIYGARRLFVARHLNQSILVEIRDMTDREAITAMDVENRQRVDITPYERGRSYAHWIGSKYFQSQDDLARSLRVSPSQVSRLLKLARLPSAIVAAFESPTDISETWGLSLMDALDDPKRRAVTLQRARAIAAAPKRPSSKDVYRRLISASSSGRPSTKQHDEIVKDCSGKPLFRIRQQRQSIALLLPVDKVSPTTMRHIREALVDIMKTGPAYSRTDGVSRLADDQGRIL